MRRRNKIIAGVLASLIALGVVAWIELPSWLAERTIEGLGITCVPLSIEISPDLSHASIARTECTVPQGPVASFTLSSGADVDLHGGQPTALRAPMIAVNPRLAETTAIATAVLVGQGTLDPLQRALVGLAHLSTRPDVPTIAIDEIDIGRGEDVLVLRTLRVQRHPDGAGATLASAGPPPYHGRVIDLTMNVLDIAVQSTRSTATLTGHFDVQGEVASFPIQRSIAFRVSGAALDGDHPTYEVWVEPSPAVDWLRSHASELLERFESHSSSSDAVRERIDAAAADRRARLDSLSERLQERVDEAHGAH
jgi:hypothetical protein